MALPTQLQSRLAFVATGAMATAVSLATLGWFQGTASLCAAAVFWLLVASLTVAVLTRMLGEEPNRRSLAFAKLAGAVAVLGAALGTYALLGTDRFTAEPSAPFFSQRGGLLLGSAALSLAFAELFASLHRRAMPDALGLSHVGRAGVWVGLVGAASVFAPSEVVPPLDGPIASGVLAVSSLLAGELLMRALAAMVSKPQASTSLSTELVVGRFLGSSYRPGQSVALGD